MEVTKSVKFQIPRYKGFKVGIFRISPIALLMSSIWSVTHVSAISCGLKQDTNVLFYKYLISNIPSSVNFDKCTFLHTNGFICSIETKPNVTLEPND